MSYPFLPHHTTQQVPSKFCKLNIFNQFKFFPKEHLFKKLMCFNNELKFLYRELCKIHDYTFRGLRKYKTIFFSCWNNITESPAQPGGCLTELPGLVFKISPLDYVSILVLSWAFSPLFSLLIFVFKNHIRILKLSRLKFTQLFVKQM